MRTHSLTRELLQRIIFRASTLQERLAFPSQPLENPAVAAVINARLEKWCKTVTKLNWARFDKRLDLEGHNLTTIRPYLAPDFPGFETPSFEIPGWAGLFEEMVQEMLPLSLTFRPVSSDFLNPTEPLPFEEVATPLVEFALQKLERQIGPNYYLLGEEARRSLARYLLQMLTTVLGRPLYLEFVIFRSRQRPAFDRITVYNAGKNELYNRFCQELLAGRLVEFFGEYSRTARRLATLVEFWLEMAGEFVDRLAADLPAIANCFKQPATPVFVSHLEPGGSDRHNRGRAVIIVTFNTGLKLVYKPKALESEEAFFKLCDWFNRQKDHTLPNLKTLRTLQRPGYGWVEFAENTPCQTQVEANRFFVRAGLLLGLFYLLRGSDFHCENIIACGEYPLPVDLETLLCPDTTSPEGSPARLYTAEEVTGRGLGFVDADETVLNISFLPFWMEEGPGRGLDISGLGGFQGQIANYKTSEWQAVNTDAMTLDFIYARVGQSPNLPELAGIFLNPDDYLAEIITGFEAVYHFFQQNQSTFLSETGPLTAFAHLRTRHILRNSNLYARLLDRTSKAEFLREGIEASLVWDGLCRPFLHSPDRSANWSIVQAEQQALAQDDIPAFYVPANSTELELGSGETIKRFFSRPGFNSVLARVQALGPGDMARQITLIQASFLARQAGAVSTILAPVKPLAMTVPVNSPDWQELAGRLREEALDLAGKIHSQAFFTPSGVPSWFCLTHNEVIKRYQVSSVNYNFYGGNLGIAFFLAALDNYRPAENYREMTLALLAPSRRWLAKYPASLQEELPIGGMDGLGALVYSWLYIGRILKDESLVEDARKVAELLTPSKIADDKALDLLAGAAGATLALLALYRETGQPGIMQKAIFCGDHLLEKQMPTPVGGRAWPDKNGRFLAGLSHGAAGPAYALAQLFRYTGLKRFRQAAQAGLDYERRLFVALSGNWPDLRAEVNPTGRDPGFANQWCHGATGIGFSRLGMLEIFDSPELKAEIAAAVQLTLNQELAVVDHLCCGTAGQISFLFEAGRKLGRSDWVDAARGRLAQLLDHSHTKGFYTLYPELPPEAFNPGFMQGAAGIGYEWLRLAEPDLLLPNCLMLE